MADEASPRRVAVGVRLAAVVLAVGAAYHFSLATLAADWRHELPLADLVLVPPLGALLLLAACRRHRYVAALKLGRLDLLLATALTLAAFALVAVGPALWSKYFWAMRIDLLTLPLFACAAVVLLFGSRSLVPFAFPLAFLLLAWPLPYLAVLEQALGAFTHATAATVAQLAPRVGIAAAVPGSDASRYVVAHGGDQIVISVASACSGVNALVGFAVVGIAGLWLVRGRLILRLAWLVAGAALVWCLNVVRILGVLLVAKQFGEHAAFDLLHPVAGIASLNLAFLVLLGSLPLFGLRIRRFDDEDEIVDTPLARAAPRSEQATPRRTAPRLALLVGAAGALALANGQLDSAASGFDNTGRPALAAFVDRPETGNGWSLRRIERIRWATPYYGRDSTWIRYRVRPEGESATGGLFTAWVDAIVSPDLGAINAYNLAHCYSFHDFRIQAARRVELGNGVVGQLFVYRTPRGVWHALAWQWPVLRRGEVEHERIVLLASSRAPLQTTRSERSGSLGGRLLALLALDAPDVDPNRPLSRALAGLASDLIAARLSRKENGVSSLATEFVFNVLQATFAVYAVLVIVHFLLQTVYAHLSHRAFVRRPSLPSPGFAPSVDVVIAVYNESLSDLQACFESLIVQDYRGELNVYVVDDCSPNRDELVPLYDRCRPVPGWRILLADRNRGKRHAQDLAFRECRGEILVTIDSDTIVAIDGVGQIVRTFEDPTVGGVTGDVGVTNWRTNLLTRLIGMRYWIAFNQERASQGWFRTVLCCSGPLAAYRKSVLDVVWTDYIRQTFRGVACTYGDDRHLTNLVLGEGYDTLFAPGAKAITNAPESMSGYLKQQLRWNKSFYRELLWTLPFLARRSRYMAFDVLVQTALPLLLTLSLVSSLFFALIVDPHYALHYAVTITIMAFVRCSYAMYRTRRPSFALFVLYGFIHACLLIPLRIRALMTLTDNRWGTRAAT